MKQLLKQFAFSVLAVIAGWGEMQDLKAQDPRFSQYYKSPLRLNPALTGAFDGTWRVGTNVRTQWGSVMEQAYNTYSLNGDAKMNVGKTDFFGIGFSAMTDQAGSGQYSISDFVLSTSYSKRLTGGGRRSYGRTLTSYLVAGGQVGFGQRSVGWDKFKFSNQYNEETNTYNTTGSGEPMAYARSSKIYPDVNIGLMWYGSFDKRNKIFGGLGLYHINRPQISLLDRTATNSANLERLYLRTSLQLGGEVQLGKKSPWSLLPGAVVMMQGPSTEINTGASLKYQELKNDDFALKIGVWNRVVQNNTGIGPDAIIFLIGLDYQSFDFGLSYDYTVSSLNTYSNGRGGLEFSVAYIFDGKSYRRSGCPTFD